MEDEQMFSKNKETMEDGIQSIEVLAEIVKANKKRVEKQKAEMPLKISELEKELNRPTQVYEDNFNTFSVEDIEASIIPKENKGDIARKIIALNEAMSKPIYSDKAYMKSIKDYLEAIRPEIEAIDKEQWKLIAEKKRIIAKYNQDMDDMWEAYGALDDKIKDLLKVVDVTFPHNDRYNKHITTQGQWVNVVANTVCLIDALLSINSGYEYLNGRNYY